MGTKAEMNERFDQIVTLKGDGKSWSEISQHLAMPKAALQTFYSKRIRRESVVVKRRKFKRAKPSVAVIPIPETRAAKRPLIAFVGEAAEVTESIKQLFS